VAENPLAEIILSAEDSNCKTLDPVVIPT